MQNIPLPLQKKHWIQVFEILLETTDPDPKYVFFFFPEIWVLVEGLKSVMTWWQKTSWLLLLHFWKRYVYIYSDFKTDLAI